MKSQTDVPNMENSDENPENFTMTFKTGPTDKELSRRFAPAIDIEEESFRENLLDYAVNHFGKHMEEDRRSVTRSPSKKRQVKRKHRSNNSSSSGTKTCGCPYAGYKRNQWKMRQREENIEGVLKDIRRYELYKGSSWILSKSYLEY